ncbi:MAG: hypothetical protein ACI8WW_002932, partial [Oceanospirillaceae bacterium]
RYSEKNDGECVNLILQTPLLIPHPPLDLSCRGFELVNLVEVKY